MSQDHAITAYGADRYPVLYVLTRNKIPSMYSSPDRVQTLLVILGYAVTMPYNGIHTSMSQHSREKITDDRR